MALNSSTTFLYHFYTLEKCCFSKQSQHDIRAIKNPPTFKLPFFLEQEAKWTRLCLNNVLYRGAIDALRALAITTKISSVEALKKNSIFQIHKSYHFVFLISDFFVWVQKDGLLCVDNDCEVRITRFSHYHVEINVLLKTNKTSNKLS
jgi:hypothetical protein